MPHIAIAAIGITEKDEHFHSICLDSGMGRNLVVGAAKDFMERLEREAQLHDWSPLALESAVSAGVARVVTDTLRDSPAAAERREGRLMGFTLSDEDLIGGVARSIRDARVAKAEEEGWHLVGECSNGEAMCDRCYSLRVSREEAVAVLTYLNEKGLLP